MKSLRLALIVSLLVFSAVAATLFVYFPHFFTLTSEIQYDVEDSEYNKSYWKQEIERVGETQAYSDFVERNSLVAGAHRHFLAHAFGEVIFEKLGIEGIYICDDKFNFGCYHGFSLRAIAQGGTEALTQLDTACTESFGPLSGCKHGLGHGILDYVGRENLSDALELCTDMIKQPAPLLGCTSGVFMEYLSPLQGISKDIQPVTFIRTPESPYTPCAEVREKFRASCYFELGQWFRQTPDTDYGALCADLDGDDKKNCFLGVGVDLTRGWKDVGILLEKCARYNKEDELSCRAGVAWSLIDNNTASEMCAYEDFNTRQKCKRMADLTQGADPSIRKSLE